MKTGDRIFYASAAAFLIGITVLMAGIQYKQYDWCAEIGARPRNNMCVKPDGSLWALRR
jgi:hypothetical protein